MPHKCPQCGATLNLDTPEGLCPACLLQRGFATEARPACGDAPGGTPFVPPSFSELSQLFPQLEVLEMLGRGGMGAVYKARQPRLDRIVALKILAPEKQADPQFTERFEREARALARLSHPNIVTVFDYGTVAGPAAPAAEPAAKTPAPLHYLLMEYVDGLTLRQVLQQGKLSPAEALTIVPRICEALQYAHEQGIVHRDIKPENILIDKQGRVKIADFGIAKMAGAEATGLSLTGARDIMGTPVYMAPEQVEKPQAVDHRADIYSLGVVFYEMLTGELPLGKFAPPSQKVQVDVRLDQVVLHALEKEPARRYQHASQVKTDVETVSGGTPKALAADAPTLPGMTADLTSDKAIVPAALLAFFFGIFGAHRFYVGKHGTGLVQLLGCVVCVFLTIGCLIPLLGAIFGLLLVAQIIGMAVWMTVDLILLLCKAFTDGQGRRITHWVTPSGFRPMPLPSAQPDRFWRRFAVVLACVILIPLFLVVATVVAAMMIPVYSKAHARADQLSAPAALPADVRSSNGEFHKELSQSFPLNADGCFRLDNVKGRIDIHGWSSNVVELKADIHGATPESVEAMKIDVNSDPVRASVHTEEPAGAGGFWNWLKNRPRNNATVDYFVRVPAGAQLDSISSVNGAIGIDGVRGNIGADTVNGKTSVQDAVANLNLSTVNGAITANLKALDDGQSIKLSAVNGVIQLAVPDPADARFTVTTVNGRITSEFPSLQPKKEFPVGNNLNGQLGQGKARVDVSAVNGTVKFVKAPAVKMDAELPAP
ncbi:MAG TPA: protein kinase [Verrucomicrobiae bacterium]